MENAFGLAERDLAYIIAAVSEFPEIQKAVVFGSRAKGNYKKGSDIDIAIFGEDISFSTIAGLHGRLEEETRIKFYIVSRQGFSSLCRPIKDDGGKGRNDCVTDDRLFNFGGNSRCIGRFPRCLF